MFHTDQQARVRARRNAATLFALGGALLLAGCYADATPVAPKPRAVHVEPVRVESLGEHHAYTGVVRARFETPMAFRVAGKLATRAVDVGALVQKGQVLATLDATDYNHGLTAASADVKAAETEVVRARGDVERAKYLFERGHVAQAQVDRFEATYRTAVERLAAAESQRAIAANRVEYTTLLADADGVVTEVAAERGQVVAEGRPVFSIARMGEKEAVVAIPENRIGDLAQMQARVSFWSQPGKSFAAELRELSPQADPATRTYVARFRLLEMPERADLGMTATIELSKPAAEARIRVAVSAIWYRGNAAQVWRAQESGKLEAVPVTVHELGQESALVSGALADGDTIVTLGVHRLDEFDAGAVRQPREARGGTVNFNLSAWAIRHQALVLFAIIALGLAGAWSYLNLGRNEDPTFTVKVMVVTAAWPGATAEEMQRQVADRIETRLQTLPWLEQIRTFTRPGFAAMQIVLKDATPPGDVQELWYQVRKKVGDVRQDIPQGVLGPFFNDEYSDVYIAVYTLTGEGARHETVVDYAEDVRKKLLQGRPCRQGRDVRRAEAKNLYRRFLPQARDARHPAAGDLRFAGAPERAGAGRHHRYGDRPRAGARHRRARRRRDGARAAGRGRRQGLPARRHRRDRPRARGSAELRRALQRSAGGCARGRHGQGRQRDRSRHCAGRRRADDPRGAAGRHRIHPHREPAARGRGGDRRIPVQVRDRGRRS